jgi:hypothetical protein
MSIMDNGAIERIAAPDLADEAKMLLDKFGGNDDVVFFLGRLVWQGQMTVCVPDLLTIATDAARGRYARIAAMRAVMSVGDAQQKDALWSSIAAHPGPLDRHLLAEILNWADPAQRSIDLLLASIEPLSPHERFKSTGLSRALHGFIDRLPIMADGAGEQPLARLVEGLNAFLDREPHIKRADCRISEAFKWLMSPALHAVDRLVAAHAEQAMAASSIAVLLKMPALRYWRSSEVGEYRGTLGQHVPRWQALNDLLYWSSIAERRARVAENGERMTDDWRVGFLGHFWNFTAKDFDRCLGWVSDMPDLDDRLVALSRCITLFVIADRPEPWADRLRAIAAGEPEMEAALEASLNPTPSPAIEKMEAEDREWKRKREEEEQEAESDRADWIRELQANPDRVRHPVGLAIGEFSGDQYHLLLSVPEDADDSDRDRGANWQALIPEFGEAVASAYRDAAIAHWRAYRPKLRSDGDDTGSTPYSLIFAMAGIAIEAAENAEFPKGLTDEEIRHALRYVTWELNGFPRWFEQVYRAAPALAFEAIEKELIWELDRSVADTPFHHVLHDIVYHSPWLHALVAPYLADWLRDHDMPNADGLRYSLSIMTGGGVSPEILAELSAAKLAATGIADQRPRWFALWADTAPDDALPALKAELEALEDEAASHFAQMFIVALLGDRRTRGSRFGAFRTAAHLKSLYVLMHHYIRAADDIDRAGGGVYSPTLRDDAQDARNALFNILSEIPGPETYAAIKSLEVEHPDHSYRKWMAYRARQRAVADADEPLWTATQVHGFASRF